jgi:hypothetical protein
VSSADPLQVAYTTVTELTELVTYAVESISLGFERWEEPYVRGPSLYFVLVAGVHSGEYADSLGENQWPTQTCRVVDNDLDTFVDAARTVAFERDGAVLISTDGTIQRQMVRIKSPGDDRLARRQETVEYADWMGTKHLSAAEISVREDVWAAVTLSEETGRVTVFEDGGFDDYPRERLGERWRSAE